MDRLAPKTLSVSNDRHMLEIDWHDGIKSLLPACFLREHCPSSTSKRDKIEGKKIDQPSDLAILDVRLIGQYAVNISFSDGHDRGIFPWVYLRKLKSVS